MPKLQTDSASTLPPPVQVIQDDAGRKIGVFVDIKTWRKLLRELEDTADIKLIQETLKDERIPWSDLKKELQREGKI